MGVEKEMDEQCEICITLLPRMGRKEGNKFYPKFPNPYFLSCAIDRYNGNHASPDEKIDSFTHVLIL